MKRTRTHAEHSVPRPSVQALPRSRPAADLGQGRQRERHSMVEMQNGAFNTKLHRDLNIARKSGRFQAHRIREAFEAATALFSCPAEIDGT